MRDRGESRKGSIDLGAWQGDGVHDLLALPYPTLLLDIIIDYFFRCSVTVTGILLCDQDEDITFFLL